MDVLRGDLTDFNTNLANETDVNSFLSKLKEIASHFTFLEEDNTTSGCFSTLLGLVEQYKHELLAGKNDEVQSK